MSVKDHRRCGRTGQYLAAIVGGVALLTAACSGGASTVDAAAEVSGSQAVTSGTLTGEFTTLGGSTIDLASLQGEDVVFWFWAPW